VPCWNAASRSETLVRNVSNSLEDVENLLGTLVDISKLDAGVIKADIAPFALSELLDNLAANTPNWRAAKAWSCTSSAVRPWCAAISSCWRGSCATC
jgi:K+-sensing histidine kinase KdpD